MKKAMHILLYIVGGVVVLFLLLAFIGSRISSKSQYKKVNGQVFFYSYPLSGADPTTFEVISEELQLAKDKTYVFSENEVIKGADASTFILLADPWNNKTHYSTYAKDKNFVFFYNGISASRGAEEVHKIESVDPISFTVLLTKSVFPSIDWQAFLVYAKDSKHVYSEDSIVEEADSATFEILTTSDGKPSLYGADERHVFDLTDGKVMDADRETFKVLSEKKAKDKNREYSAPPSWHYNE